MSTECVQVKLELGHKASVRSKPTTEGFTHDWTVFVRGPDNTNISHFVERIIFNLHESFPRPKRIVKDPPFQVSESGYAGFVILIEVFFKNKEDPKFVKFEYDLFLHVGGPASNRRAEKLIFQNPTEDFRRKLIRAGGVGILNTPDIGDAGTVFSQPEAASTDSSVTVSSKPSASPEQSKKPKPLSSSKNSASIVPLRPQPAEPFVALFGQPIKTSKPSPDSRKNKVDKDPSKNGSGKTSKSSSGRPAGGAPVMAARKEPKLTTSKVKKKEEKKPDGETKKRKRIPSNTSTNSKVKEVKKKKKSNDSDTEKEKEKEKPKPKVEKKKKIKESKKSDSDDTSPGSSISLSTLNISGKRGPLGTLMAELEANDDGELVSPLSSNPPSPPQFSTSENEKKLNSFEQELQNLHKQISLLQNRDQLQQITDIIEETGLYTVSQNSFDFDLHALDNETIRKLVSVVPVF
uniref:YEATS domain-containing protein n=1 Tax=Strigamia maritima TaxID=126957 RepID=T1JP90_STRMM